MMHTLGMTLQEQKQGNDDVTFKDRKEGSDKRYIPKKAWMEGGVDTTTRLKMVN